MTNIVKEVREQRKMTQTGLSDAVGISRRALVSIEKQQTVPSVDTALRLSKVLGVGVDKLFIDTAVTDTKATNIVFPDGDRKSIV